MGEDEVRDIEQEINRAINSDNDEEVLQGYLTARRYWDINTEDAMWREATDDNGITYVSRVFDNTNVPDFTISHLDMPSYMEFNDMFNEEIANSYRNYNIDKSLIIQEFNQKCENCNREECVVINCFIDHIFSNYNLRRK